MSKIWQMAVGQESQEGGRVPASRCAPSVPIPTVKLSQGFIRPVTSGSGGGA